ncbi:hypothetical protein Xaut_0247 [Xanthobacter versatilis]|uniref:Uncharacterized protein n=1 Tax=Xanthobacter autotrophicus (strain ATCC BAA-1158 / Py2) TaxID=78245 RepID=A7IBW2_XANP2|nr:hypothetical protein Xaut_0247 [Xanthobacter autotrophicus Py2]
MKSDFGQNAGSPLAEEEAVPPRPAARPSLTFDAALYDRYLAESGLSQEQKREFLETLWAIIVGFVELGFGVDPVAHALLGCGRDEETGPPDEGSVVLWEGDAKAEETQQEGDDT